MTRALATGARYLILTSSCTLLALLIGGSATQVHPQDLSYSFRLEKDTLLVGEDGQFEFEIKNNGDTSLKVDYPYFSFDFPETFQLIVTDQFGTVHPWNGMEIHIADGRQSSAMIPAGDVFVENNSLAWYGRKKGLRSPYGMFPPGTYYVRLVYRPRVGMTAYQSPSLRFCVIEPKGEETGAFELWNQEVQFNWGERRDRQIQLLTELVNKYPMSAYRPAALPRLIDNLLFTDDTAGARFYLEESLTHYNSSVWSMEAVIKFAWKMDKEHRLELYRSLSQEYRGTLLEERLTRSIRVWERL